MLPHPVAEILSSSSSQSPQQPGSHLAVRLLIPRCGIWHHLDPWLVALLSRCGRLLLLLVRLSWSLFLPLHSDWKQIRKYLKVQVSYRARFALHQLHGNQCTKEHYTEVLLMGTGWCAHGNWGTMCSPSLPFTTLNTPQWHWRCLPSREWHNTFDYLLPWYTSVALDMYYIKPVVVLQ